MTDHAMKSDLIAGSSSSTEKHAQPGDAGKHVLIMGAGPAGLTAAYECVVHQTLPVTVVEMDPRYVGGISRTVEYHGYRFDIGGHRFFSKNREIEDLWTEILGDELLKRPRLSRIVYRGRYFDYPLKAVNALRNLGLIETIRCLASYAVAKMVPVRNPRNFADWVSNAFGQRLFQIFFKTYTEKVWGMSTQELSADWAAQRIKGLDLTAAIKNAVHIPPLWSSLLRRWVPLSTREVTKKEDLITTLIDEFRYPRLGPGQMWERIQVILEQHQQPVLLGQEVIAIHHDGQQVTRIDVREPHGAIQSLCGSQVISTIPIRHVIERCSPALPDEVLAAARQLKYRDFLTVALIINAPALFPDNWIYLHDETILAGRIQNFKNWSPDMVADPQKTCLGLEYFCFEGDGLWESPDQDLVQLAGSELVKLRICSLDMIEDGVVVRQPKAYPVYDDQYKSHVKVIREYAECHLSNLYFVGRNGMHHYNNQDHSMMTALLAARNIALGACYDPWKVNTDAEYHEEARCDDQDPTGRMMPQHKR